jgi:ubiquinone/menaquinone biosynthesis C-methylase UbiE
VIRELSNRKKMESLSTPRFRVDYDQIAHLYDQQPYRQKEVDPHLLKFLNAREFKAFSSLSILDMACGTGNQLIANRPYVQGARLVGLDLFHGMLQRAVAKTHDILWVQATCDRPPFPDNSFDFISNQYAFHHVCDKQGMISSVFRILRPGGRFVMTNLCPQEMQDWIYYQYFPEALEIDLQDFLPKDTIVDLLIQEGFEVNMELEHMTIEQSLQQFWKVVSRRDTCSQLLTISDSAYQAGLQRLEQELQHHGDILPAIKTKICLITIQADKPEK